MTIRGIWAESRAGIIGAGRTIPWNLPEDQQEFRRRTIGATVLMGRRTWQSLPDVRRPLPNRRNVVLTRDPAFTAPGAELVRSVDQALTLGDLWVIGGEIVLRAFLPHITLVVRTRIDIHVTGGVYAPHLGDSWTVTQSTGWKTAAGGRRYVIEELIRHLADRGYVVVPRPTGQGVHPKLFRISMDAALAGAKDRFDHGEAQHDPDVIALIRAAETMYEHLFGDLAEENALIALTRFADWLNSNGQLAPVPDGVTDDNTDMILHFLHDQREAAETREAVLNAGGVA